MICDWDWPLPSSLVHQDARFEAPTWTFGANYQVDDGLMLYATVSRGYKSGGFNSVSTPALFNFYEPEFVTEGELGAKSQLHVGDADFLLNADIYRGNYFPIQVAQIELVNNCCCDANRQWRKRGHTRR